MTDHQDSDQTFAAPADEAACLRVISRYSAAVDWANRDALKSIFLPDASFDFGAAFFVGSGAAGIDFLIASVNASMCRTHTLGTTCLTVAGTHARGETPAVNVWISRNPDNSITRYFITARYLWELEKRGAEWRVSSLKIIMTTAQCTPYDLAAQPPGFELQEGLGVDHSLYPGAHC